MERRILTDYILRGNYLNQINQFKDKPIIKILTGMRRVGKSTILKMGSNILLSSIPEDNKIFLNFESFNLLRVRNAEKLTEYIQITMSGKEGKNVTVDTVINYLNFCQQAFLIKKVSRYDTVGKKLLKIDEKYYLTDHGFRQAKGFSNIADIERTLENIVYMELLSRGFRVKIGKVNAKEIDFIAEKDK